MKSSFPNYKQPDSKDCGPTCLRIVAKHYGKLISLQEIRDISETTREGSSLLKLSLKMLRLTSDEVLQRSQMKKITGGYGCARVYCHCTDGGAGAWEGTYCSGQEISAATARNCSRSGVCA